VSVAVGAAGAAVWLADVWLGAAGVGVAVGVAAATVPTTVWGADAVGTGV
jgi:hypothetical protein